MMKQTCNLGLFPGAIADKVLQGTRATSSEVCETSKQVPNAENCTP